MGGGSSKNIHAEWMRAVVTGTLSRRHDLPRHAAMASDEVAPVRPRLHHLGQLMRFDV